MSDKPPSKHRVIDWNPAAHQGAKTSDSSGRNKLFAAIAVIAVVVAAAAVTFSLRQSQTPVPVDGEGVALQQVEKEPAYVSRGRAELAYASATETLKGIRRLPADHPNLMQEIALIERAYIAAESQINNGNYAVAAKSLDALATQMESFTETVEMQKNAKKRYDDLYSRLRLAERIKSFDPAAYDTAYASIGEGRLLLEQGSFRAAWGAFDAADTTLKDFEARKTEYVAENMRQGQIALNRGDEANAVAAFKAALTYDSANEAGLRGLDRAKTITQVHALLEKAQAAEEMADYDTAIAAFEEAMALDEFSVVAQQGAARAKADQKESRFNQFIAAADTATEAADWGTVIARYEDALEVYPKRDDIKDLLDQARVEHHDAEVHNTLAEAYDLERDYNWDQARLAYERLLDLEPEHADAIEGLIRVGRTVRAKLEYEKLIELTQQLIDASDYQAAIRRYNGAMQTKPGYLEISPDIAAMRDVLERNSKPVNITFLSDTRTWVSITNFRMLGKIKNETVALPPGDYEVVGRRKKYQDVLLLLKVRPQMSTNQVEVVCNTRADS
ncbi:tetratricopeptide repeat protein [Synoicihabitans lomoniglobus]|uniref:Tetratricopeptide repeat protein n=1 Tax=Synoicihabitans lomoniglobus TaxID=2909285 RepID=A0AAE9ZY92_9BACT|nr:hypothetical protein [Opitutaceae bacterium LMO-M01]WED65230.1 hypothetical protein PXH66_23065 [Opitutaceae bacterium LMO-M01]